MSQENAFTFPSSRVIIVMSSSYVMEAKVLVILLAINNISKSLSKKLIKIISTYKLMDVRK